MGLQRAIPTVEIVTDLRALRADNFDNIIVYATGLATVSDGQGGYYIWNQTSTATDDGVRVLEVSGVTTGRWIKVNTGSSYYNSGGLISSNLKKWIGMVTPSTGNGYSIDISSAGFSAIECFSVVAIKNTGTLNSIPVSSVKSYSTTELIVNIIETQVINALGDNPVLFADTTGLTLSVEVCGY